MTEDSGPTRWIFRVLENSGAPWVWMCRDCYWYDEIFNSHLVGYDVHNHAPGRGRCLRTCLTQVDGRAHQVALFDRLSVDPLGIYRMAKKFDGIRGEGTLQLNGLRVGSFYNVRTSARFYEPLTSRDAVEDVLGMNQTLARAGVPQWAGFFPLLVFRCFQSARTAPNGALPLPGSGDAEIERHAVALHALDGSNGIVFVNSWGRQWGDRGLGTMSWDYFERYWSEAWVSRNCSIGWNRFNYDRLTAATGDARLLRDMWMMNNARWQKSFRLGSARITCSNWETISVNDGYPVDVVEARTGYGLRVGWVFVSHLPGRVSELREIYVWPVFRRQGIGGLLEELAVALARRHGASTVRMWLHEADGHVKVRAAGRTFGLSRKYAWRWRSLEHPRLTAVGDKNLSADT